MTTKLPLHAFPDRTLDVSSKDKLRSTQTPSQFTASLGYYTIEVKPGYLTYIGIIDARIPNSFYPISSTTNSLKFTETNGVTPVAHTITIPPAYYAGSTLATAIETAMNAAASYGATYTVTYNSDTNKLTFGGSGAGTTTGVTLDLSDALTTCLEVIGFSSTDTATFVPNSTTVTSSTIINLGGPTKVQIRSSNVVERNFSFREQSLTDVILNIHTTGDRFGVTNYHTETPILSRIGSSIRELSIYITDHNGRLIDFNGIDTDFTFGIYYVKE